jgi:hypothetical protein
VGYDPFTEENFRLLTEIDGKLVAFNTAPVTTRASLRDQPSSAAAENYLVRQTEVCMFVYDVTNRANFDVFTRHHDNFMVVRSRSPPRPPLRGLFFVIARKIDKDKAEWQVSLQEGEDLSAAMGAIFLQMSAKTGEGASQEVLADIARLVLLRRMENIYLGIFDEKVERNEGIPHSPLGLQYPRYTH